MRSKVTYIIPVIKGIDYKFSEVMFLRLIFKAHLMHSNKKKNALKHA